MKKVIKGTSHCQITRMANYIFECNAESMIKHTTCVKLYLCLWVSLALFSPEYEKNGAPKNFVDRVFGGKMSSTVMCKECRTVSLVTEMFLDLSLPVADEVNFIQQLYPSCEYSGEGIWFECFLQAYRKKNQKKVTQYRSSVSDDGDKENTTSLTNGNEDMPTETGSKYQQKKAKKQAKKQAKVKTNTHTLVQMVNKVEIIMF